jgi:hypothetical protein
MRTILAFVVGMLAASPAMAAASVDVAPAPPAETFQLDTVLVVHGWILCVSQATAMQIAEARAVSLEAAQSAYDQLAAAKSCGKFPKLGVMLHDPLYRSAPGLQIDTRVFGAMVNIGVGWQHGFVVAGGLPE